MKVSIGNTYATSLLILFSFLGVNQIFAQNKMIVTYENGKQQQVTMDQPSCNIESIRFDSGETGKNDGKEYTDYQGNKVYISCGKLAFADRVVKHTLGNPAPSDQKSKNPSMALGEPDYINATENAKRSSSAHFTLGCGGQITLEFTNVLLVDINGPDLYVFECGQAVEPTELEISKDGVNWIKLGRISGGKASVDIHDFVKPNDQFRFVRLTDLKADCGGATPGADIDAVAAIGCVKVK